MSDKIFENVGSKLQKARKEKGWTLERLSDQCGIAPSNLSNYEGGARMTLATLISIVKALGVSYDSILGESNCMVFDIDASEMSPQNIANAIEYLVRNSILVREKVSESQYFRDDSDPIIPFIDSNVLSATKLNAGSSPYNTVVVKYPYCIPVMRYITNVKNNAGLIDSETELDSFYQLHKNVLKKELKNII